MIGIGMKTSMKHCHSIILLMAMTEVMGALSQAQQFDKVGAEWWLNLPSSPLTFVVSPSKHDLALVNQSSGRIVRYRLGCVREERNKTRTVYKGATVGTDLATGEAILNSLSVYARYKDRCDRKPAKLTVVEVEFADGSVWKANWRQ